MIVSSRPLGKLSHTALAFRGYNQTNLGRTPELLELPAYRPILERHLTEAAAAASDALSRPVDLLARVRKHQETDLSCYAEAVSLIAAVELAQVEILRERFGVDVRQARLALGYSLGEVIALAVCGSLDGYELLRVPLEMADDCVALADDVRMGILFSREKPLPLEQLELLLADIRSEHQGVIGLSTVLSPNSVLVLGQQATCQRLHDRIEATWPFKVHLRLVDGAWPPLHTPIMWLRHIPTRSAVAMMALKSGRTAPSPPILSMVTGRISYTNANVMRHLQNWVDHPQLLWPVVEQITTLPIDRLLHFGPDPNLIPATFRRLSDNVLAQQKKSLGVWALAPFVRRPWLKTLLPARTHLLRAPQIEHVIVEDWLIANAASADCPSTGCLPALGPATDQEDEAA